MVGLWHVRLSVASEPSQLMKPFCYRLSQKGLYCHLFAPCCRELKFVDDENCRSVVQINLRFLPILYA